MVNENDRHRGEEGIPDQPILEYEDRSARRERRLLKPTLWTEALLESALSLFLLAGVALIVFFMRAGCTRWN